MSRELAGALLAVLIFAPALPGDTSAWTVLGVQDTGISRDIQTLIAVRPTSGDIYSSGLTVGGGPGCPQPTRTLNGNFPTAACVTRTSASGKQVYSTAIPGALVQAIVVDGAGNAYITGSASPEFAAVTPVAYKSTPPGVPNQFVCELSATDGHAMFCTFVDAAGILYSNSANVLTTGGFAIDTAGNSYIAGTCAPDFLHLCVEKLNATGTALGYRSTLNTNLVIPPSSWGPAWAAVDAKGNLYVAQANAGIVKLSASGAVAAAITDTGSDLPIGLVLDPAGNPQVLSRDSVRADNLRMRRYGADLSAILFDTPVFAGIGSSVFGIAVDPAGITNLWGGTSGINFPSVHPTQNCLPPAPGGGSTSGAFLVRLGAAGGLLQSTCLDIAPHFVVTSPMLFDSGGASLLYVSAEWEIVKLGPAASEIVVSSIGNGATFENTPLAPNEIVSLFGAGVGPALPVIAQPDVNGSYPFRLGGTQVSFDGVAAPLLYADSNQINLITPNSLRGRTSTHICALINGAQTNCIDMQVLPAAPGIFTSGLRRADGTPFAIALNQDATINSEQNPAAAGSIVSLFVTGLGATTQPVPDGGITPYPSPAQELNARVDFEWSTSTFPFDDIFPAVLYAGPAPLEVEGLGQINVVAQPAPMIGQFFGGPWIHVEVTLADGKTKISSPRVALWMK
jgi:uncharacterized protein (TIGR03437 family)